MGKATYCVSGQIEGAVWEDFVSDDGPPVTIMKGKHDSLSEIGEDGWYDVELADFNRENILIMLSAICRKEVVLVENKECMAV